MSRISKSVKTEHRQVTVSVSEEEVMGNDCSMGVELHLGMKMMM